MKKNQIHLTQGKIQFLVPGIFNNFFSRDAFEFVLKNADDVKGVSKGIVFFFLNLHLRLFPYANKF